MKEILDVLSIACGVLVVILVPLGFITRRRYKGGSLEDHLESIRSDVRGISTKVRTDQLAKVVARRYYWEAPEVVEYADECVKEVLNGKLY
jgi:hypothetical protein